MDLLLLHFDFFIAVDFYLFTNDFSNSVHIQCLKLWPFVDPEKLGLQKKLH